MKKWSVISVLFAAVFFLLSFMKEDTQEKSLRRIYSGPPSSWPAPHVDDGVQWKELGVLPPGPLAAKKDSLKDLVELGKMLFFDTRLSGSGKISCASCHQPELSWTDGKERSSGHEGALGKRNSPSLQNVWFYDKLFWDGRAKDLQDQAFAPINSETEMHSEMADVMRQLRRIDAYKALFKKAFGDDAIDPDRMTEAIATFEKTISSNKSRFDLFLEGDQKALSNSELKGLHLFRTRARCMNCHHGPLFSDNRFHRNNITFSYDDDGLYNVTHNKEDKMKFKTPSLRDVLYTGPWMHNGRIDNLEQVISRYSSAKYPPGEASPHLRQLGLSWKEQKQLLSFLKAISAPPAEFSKPVLPQ